MATGDREGRATQGRYQGIGIASPGNEWKKIEAAPAPANDKQATLADDDYVVFVTDSRTGEVRECGDRSGFCTSIQPWDRAAPRAPLAVTAHAKQEELTDNEIAPDNTTTADTKAK